MKNEYFIEIFSKIN